MVIPKILIILPACVGVFAIAVRLIIMYFDHKLAIARIMSDLFNRFRIETDKLAPPAHHDRLYKEKEQIRSSYVQDLLKTLVHQDPMFLRLTEQQQEQLTKRCSQYATRQNKE